MTDENQGFKPADPAATPSPTAAPPQPAAPSPLDPVGPDAPTTVIPTPVVAAPTTAATTPPAIEPAGAGEFARVEPVAAASTAAVGAAPTVAKRRSSGVRWAIALGVVALIVAGTAGIVALAGARNPTTSQLAGYMPAGTWSYTELRLDLPGDQRQKFASFMQHFPGFDDPATLDTKVQEALDQLVAAATKDEMTWTSDVKPWFGGTVALGIAVSQASATNAATATPVATPNMLGAITITDRAKAVDFISRAADGQSLTKGTYNGADIWTSQDGGTTFAIAATPDVLLVGDLASVQAGIDSKGQGNLASQPGMSDVLAEASDSVGFSYTNIQAYAASLTGAMGAGADLDKTQIDDVIVDMLPAWSVGTFGFEDDAVAFEGWGPRGSLATGSTNRQSEIADHLPPTTFVAIEGNDAGQNLMALIDKFRALDELKDSFKQIDDMIGLVGGFNGLLGWMGDTAIVGATVGDDLAAGLVSIPTDPAAAKQELGSIRALLTLSGLAGISVTDEDYKGTTITTVDLGELAELIPMGDSAPFQLSGRALISFAATDEVVVIGSGPAFVKAVLDAGSGASLADDARYAALLERVGAANTGWAWVDTAAVVGMVDGFVADVDPTAAASWNTEAKPFLAPLDAIISATIVDGNEDRTKAQFTVK